MLMTLSLPGAAPLQRAIMYGRTHTGVSLQTLDELAFDRGLVLAQTPLPGIPVPGDCTAGQLQQLLTPAAAQLLIEGLRAGVHVPPREDFGWKPTEDEAKSLKNAYKVGKNHRQIRWDRWPPSEFDRRQRALGPLWSLAVHQSGVAKRLIFDDFDIVPIPEQLRISLSGSNCGVDDVCDADRGSMIRPVTWLYRELAGRSSSSGSEAAWQLTVPYLTESGTGAVLLPTARGEGCLRVLSVKEEGCAVRQASHVFGSFSHQR